MRIRKKTAEQMRAAAQQRHEKSYHYSESFFRCRHEMCLVAAQRVLERHRQEMQQTQGE